MKTKAVSGIMLTLLLIDKLTLAFNIEETEVEKIEVACLETKNEGHQK